jgi:hypothetical protein
MTTQKYPKTKYPKTGTKRMKRQPLPRVPALPGGTGRVGPKPKRRSDAGTRVVVGGQPKSPSKRNPMPPIPTWQRPYTGGGRKKK